MNVFKPKTMMKASNQHWFCFSLFFFCFCISCFYLFLLSPTLEVEWMLYSSEAYLKWPKLNEYGNKYLKNYVVSLWNFDNWFLSFNDWINDGEDHVRIVIYGRILNLTLVESECVTQLGEIPTLITNPSFVFSQIHQIPITNSKNPLLPTSRS